MDSNEEDQKPTIQQLRPFPCTEPGCKKAFARRSDLVRHCRIHSNDRPFICTWAGCTRDFIQRSALTVHIRVHTGERPHKCEYEGCKKAFSDSSSLARHRRIHTGKRPYICLIPSCRKTFCRKTTLTKHSQKHHKNNPMEGTTFKAEPEDDFNGRTPHQWDSYASTEPSTPSENQDLESAYASRSAPDPSYYGANTHGTRRTSYKGGQARQVWNPDTHEPETSSSRALRSHVTSDTRDEPLESSYLAVPVPIDSRKLREVSCDGSGLDQYSNHSTSPFPQEPQMFTPPPAFPSPQFIQNNMPEYSAPNYQYFQQYAPVPHPQFAYSPSISQHRQMQQQNLHPQHAILQFQQYQRMQQPQQFDNYHHHAQQQQHHNQQFQSHSGNEGHSNEYQPYIQLVEPTSPSPYQQFRRASSTSVLEIPSGMVGAFSSETMQRRYSFEGDSTGQHSASLLPVEEEEFDMGSMIESAPMSFGNSGGYFSSADVGGRRNSLVANSFGNLANALQINNYRSGAMGGTSFSSYITQHIDNMADESMTLSY